jgi:hypothetical protein
MATFPQLGKRRVPQNTRGIASYDTSAEGRAIEQFGRTGMAVAEDMQKEEDAREVFAARRSLDEWERANLYDSNTGAAAKLGRDSFDLPNTIPKSFDAFSEQVRQGVSSRRAKQAVEEMLISRRDQALGFVDRHVLQQRQVFEEGQFQADITSSLNRTAQLVDAGDMNTAAAETRVAQQRAIGFMKARGKSEEEIAAKTREISSAAAVSTINLLLDKDKPLEAEKFLKANAGSMRVEDMLRAQGVVGKAIDAYQGLAIATSVVEGRLKPAVQPTDFGRLSNLAGELTPFVKQAESNGKRYGPDGKLLTSPKGAEGEMQVVKDTQRDPGFGVRPADMSGTKEQQADEIARVGRDYLAAMVREFKGNVPQALAAYNAGPGRVQDAIKAAAKDGTDWFAKMPDETKAYVAKITKAYGDGGGQPQMPTLQQLRDEVRALIPETQPQRRKIALEEVTRQHDEMLKAKKQQEDEATAKGYEWLQGNGGRFSQMPTNIRAAIPAKEFDNLMNYGARVAKGDDITDPVVFNKMATDDAWLRTMTDAQFLIHSRKLSQADAQQMALRRGKLINGESGAKGPNDLDTAGVNSILNNRLQQIGIDPSPKDAGADAQRVGAIRKYVWDSVLQAQQAAGKKFNDAETASMVDKLFAQNVTFQNTFLGFNTGKDSQRLLSMKPGDIPGDVKRRLREDFKAAGITDPTDADLLGAYFELRGRR